MMLRVSAMERDRFTELIGSAPTNFLVMDFSPSEDHEAIREGVQRVCSQFPDEYWREKDDQHEFPWDFYEAMAEGGWIGIAIPEEFGGGGQGITEASIVLEEVAASGRGMTGCSAIPF